MRPVQVLLADEVLANYDVARESLQQYIESLHKEWTESIDPDCARRLENNLLFMDRQEGNLLVMNFDQTLITMFQEVHYWERMRFSIPLVAMEIQAQREKYRVLRENVLRVVRDYNKVRPAVPCLSPCVNLCPFRPPQRSAFPPRATYFCRAPAVRQSFSWPIPLGVTTFLAGCLYRLPSPCEFL